MPASFPSVPQPTVVTRASAREQNHTYINISTLVYANSHRQLCDYASASNSRMATSIRAHQVLKIYFGCSTFACRYCHRHLCHRVKWGISFRQTRNRTSNELHSRQFDMKILSFAALKCDRRSNSFINFIMKCLSCTETSPEIQCEWCTHSHLSFQP